MQIIEQTLVPKNKKIKSEDGIVVADDFIAVIDGSTSKSSLRYSRFSTNGRLAMKIISKVIKHAPKEMSCHEFCIKASRAIACRYSKKQIDQLRQHPEDRLTASCALFSRLRREIWLIGDCQCLVNGELFDNPKPNEQQIAMERAEIINSYEGDKSIFLQDDWARKAIIPHMIETMKQQNISYAVIDGFSIPEQFVKIIQLDFNEKEIVLATDGYPFLRETLDLSEQLLARQLAEDPLNIGDFKATKAYSTGNNSFDDRAYIRFKA